MQTFDVEEEYVLEEGTCYTFTHVGHYGVAVSKECMTYSFGYRSYTDQELWDNFGDYVAERHRQKHWYRAPDWAPSYGASELPPIVGIKPSNYCKT